MRQALMKSRLIVFAFLCLGVAACRTLSNASGNQNEPTMVEVQNQSFLDMTVYAERNSQRVRLGLATGNAKTRFVIPPGIVTGITTLRFIADPIGSSRASVSQEISVTPGDTVVMTIPPG